MKRLGQNRGRAIAIQNNYRMTPLVGLTISF